MNLAQDFSLFASIKITGNICVADKFYGPIREAMGSNPGSKTPSSTDFFVVRPASPSRFISKNM